MKLTQWELQSAFTMRDWQEMARIVSKEIGIEPPEYVVAELDNSNDWLYIKIIKGFHSWTYWCDGVCISRSYPPSSSKLGDGAFIR